MCYIHYACSHLACLRVVHQRGTVGGVAPDGRQVIGDHLHGTGVVQGFRGMAPDGRQISMVQGWLQGGTGVVRGVAPDGSQVIGDRLHVHIICVCYT